MKLKNNSYDLNGNSAFSYPIGKHSSYRNNGSSLKLLSMRFASEEALSHVERWIRGCPEIRLRFISGNAETDQSAVTYYSSVMEPPSRKAIYNQDWQVNVSLPNWDCSEYGDIIVFSWQEEDNSVDETFKLSAQVEGKTGRECDGLSWRGGFI